MWHPSREISKQEYLELSNDLKKYCIRVGDHYELMSEPERYVNHSCDPNTVDGDQADVACRDIQPGEEITTNYKKSSFSKEDTFPVCYCPRCTKLANE